MNADPFRLGEGAAPFDNPWAGFWVWVTACIVLVLLLEVGPTLPSRWRALRCWLGFHYWAAERTNDWTPRTCPRCHYQEPEVL